MSRTSAPVGVKLSAFNWRMWDARREAGFTQQDLAQLTGIQTHRIGTIETLRTKPRPDEQQEIADALNRDVRDLFPPEVLALYGNASTTLRVAVPAERMAQLVGRPAEAVALPEAIRQAGLHEAVEDVVSSLQPREQAVLMKRFGLDGDGVRTLEESARDMGVTRERIRQIEAKALRKLRHPSRAKMVREYIEGDATRIPQGVAAKIRREPEPNPDAVGRVPGSRDDEQDDRLIVGPWHNFPCQACGCVRATHTKQRDDFWDGDDSWRGLQLYDIYCATCGVHMGVDVYA